MMKKLKFYFLLIAIVSGLSGCFEDSTVQQICVGEQCNEEGDTGGHGSGGNEGNGNGGGNEGDGNDGGSEGGVSPPIKPNQEYFATLVTADLPISGDVFCNDRQVGLDGSFKVREKDNFSCQFGSVVLSDFTAPEINQVRLGQELVFTASFDIELTKGKNATAILQSINQCRNQDKICLKEIDSFDISVIYNSLDDQKAVDDFLAVKDEEVTDDIGNAPSSHVDNDLVPAVTPGSSNNLNNEFISATAESSYIYQPSEKAKVLTRAQLTDVNHVPIVGIDFYSENATGVTDENGEFEFLWGDQITFGIDTFSFGSVRGNQTHIYLGDVTGNPVEKDNIQSLLMRYLPFENNTFMVTDKIRSVFSQYPNSINTLINLSLPNGGVIAGTGFNIPNEFKAQFTRGQTRIIDDALRISSRFTRQYQNTYFLDSSAGAVTKALNQIFDGVSVFHIFNDNQGFYGATGYSRGMRSLNLSNRAFPIMMPRVDINHRIPFGQDEAWTREGKPHIVRDPKGLVNPMPPVPKVSQENAVFGLPFVTAGRIGGGHVIFMGNNMYPSILSCPMNYWANSALVIDSIEKSCVTSPPAKEDPLNDNGSMKRYFDNLFTWLNADYPNGNIALGTNITQTLAARSYAHEGQPYEFFVDASYTFSEIVQLNSGDYGNLSVISTPILVLQAYETESAYYVSQGQSGVVSADISRPKLTPQDVTDLMNYVAKGGNIIFMEAIIPLNPEPIARLADAAGVSLGGQNMTPTNQLNCGGSYYCQNVKPNLSVKGQYEIVVYQQMDDVNGKPPYTVMPNGQVEWVPPEEMPTLTIPMYEEVELDSNQKPTGRLVEKYALISVKNAQERQSAIEKLQKYFPDAPVCTDKYEYEINCIETRSGNGIPMLGNYGRPIFDRYQVSPEVVKTMIKSANLGDNLEALYHHELYYRTRGQVGSRLSESDLNQRFDSLAVWFWNDNQYIYDPNVGDDELGFKAVATFLNCYTNNQHQELDDVLCKGALQEQLHEHGMIHGTGALSGQLNPSYPLNYMEKPLTRIMLGRSYWDHHIQVDVTDYPGINQGSVGSFDVIIQTGGKGVISTAGNNQPTGLWAPQLSSVTVAGGVPANIHVMMADDLTNLPKHEKALQRPPRMESVFAHDGMSTRFQVPYGGLISIQPLQSTGELATQTTFRIAGVSRASFWQEGNWIHPFNEDVPFGIIDTGSFVYITAANNLKADLNQFSNDMNRFAEAASDFYGRDEVTENGLHRRFTYSALKGYRHRFHNDVQISIGAAHSGYPVMNVGFNPTASNLPTNAIDDWLLWHEVGHNLATHPFMIDGSTEVSNNLLALYMQELKGRNDNPEMDRIRLDIQKAPIWLREHGGHGWSHGHAGIRLVMFGQLKVWAETHFNIEDWYSNQSNQPNIYNEDQGWNFFKLLHRKARGDDIGDKNGVNYCRAEETKLKPSDLLMVCMSYVSGYDLSEFFKAWNPGEKMMTSPEGIKVYSNGITASGYDVINQLGLKKPPVDPISINRLP